MLALSEEDCFEGNYMLSALRSDIIKLLWSEYKTHIGYLNNLPNGSKLKLDHFAIIDFNSSTSGIGTLSKIFEMLGFHIAGKGYLPEKINDFIWMREPDFLSQEIEVSLPQIVLADFRTNLLSDETQTIIGKYSNNIPEFDFASLEEMLNSLENGDKAKYDDILKLIFNYVNSRPWPAPTTEDYNKIKEEHELIAWVLLMGRRVNHFGIQINDYTNFDNLENFVEHYKQSNSSKINAINGEIKGGARDGIAQASSIGNEISVKTADGSVITHDSFLEFVWRYKNSDKDAKTNSDQYSEFVAKNANYVIESLCNESNS